MCFFLNDTATTEIYTYLHTLSLHDALPISIGLFHPFLDDAKFKMIGVEAAGEGLQGKHAASLAGGKSGILHGNRTYLLQDEDGQITEAHSISAGLDYPGIGPEHSRSEEHTSELQSLMRISYAVFCLKKKTIMHIKTHATRIKVGT